MTLTTEMNFKPVQKHKSCRVTLSNCPGVLAPPGGQLKEVKTESRALILQGLKLEYDECEVRR